MHSGGTGSALDFQVPGEAFDVGAAECEQVQRAGAARGHGTVRGAPASTRDRARQNASLVTHHRSILSGNEPYQGSRRPAGPTHEVTFGPAGAV